MTKYILKRIGMMLITLFMIVLLTFILMHSVPGGPFTTEKQVAPAVLKALEAKYHLDDPLWKQFVDYVKGLLTFELGPSFKFTGKTVNDFIENGFPFSATLGLITLVFVLLTALPMGLVAALRAGDVAGVARRMYNVFEDALDRRAAQAVGEIKRCLLDNGALGAVMSGSGSAVYGLFPNRATASAAADAAKSLCREVFLTETV